MVLLYSGGTKYVLIHWRNGETDLSEAPIPMDAPRCGGLDSTLLWFEGKTFHHIGESTRYANIGNTSFDVLDMYSTGNVIYCIGETKIGCIESPALKHNLIEFDRPIAGSNPIVIWDDNHYDNGRYRRYYFVCSGKCFKLGCPDPITKRKTLWRQAHTHSNQRSGSTLIEIIWTGDELELDIGNAWVPKQVEDGIVYSLRNSGTTMFFDEYYRKYEVNMIADYIHAIEMGKDACLITCTSGKKYAADVWDWALVGVDDDYTLCPARQLKSARPNLDRDPSLHQVRSSLKYLL